MLFLMSDTISIKDYKDVLLDRFLNYVRTYSQSDSVKADEGVMPSTPQQKDMALLLRGELERLGLSSVQTTEHCYTYGILPASKGKENIPSICLLSHIDTAEAVSGKDVKPIVHKAENIKSIELNCGVVLDPNTDKYLFAALKNGETIITSDGSTLLGADDKAGVSEIITALDYIIHHKEIEHGAIEVIFSPDEETGHGMDKVPLDLLQSKVAYTVDGGHIGELEKECFNAFKSDVTFIGKSKHTGTARPDMVSAISMLASFVETLPHSEVPEGYMGFYSPQTISGTIEEAQVSLILRDFAKEGIEKRMQIVDLVANTVATTFGGKVKVCHTKQYLNMKEELDKRPEVVLKLEKAYKNAGIEPRYVPIRGGTDGSRLTEMGIPTPNIFTGGHNFHSRYEWASLEQMIAATDVLIQLIKIWAS